jgi:hypothetical protein
LPVRAYLLLPFVGAITAAALSALAGFPPRSMPTGPGHLVAIIVSLVTVALAPLAGIPVARSIASGRYGARLDRVAIAAVCLGGIFADVTTVLLS